MRTVHLSKATLEPWAILPQALSVIVEVVTRHFSGEKLDAEEVQMRIHGAKRPPERIQGEIAVLPLFGTIFPRANLFTEISGGTSAELFGKRFDELLNDPSIGAIVLDVDSPGGSAYGIEELSAKIFSARGRKPIVAVADHTMASAAYYIGTAADELVVSPSGEVGSIGVYAIHEDVSKQLENEGIKLTILSEGKYKTAGNAYQPLEEEAKAVLQERISEIYEQFLNAVARNRGVEVEEVRNGFGEGHMVGASQAVKLGMADRVETLEETIERLQTKGWRSPRGEKLSTGLTTDYSALEAPTAQEEPAPILAIHTNAEETVEGVADEAAASDAVESDTERAAEVERLRNYVEIFGSMKGGE